MLHPLKPLKILDSSAEMTCYIGASEGTCYYGIKAFKALTVGRGDSVRKKITTTIEEAILNKAKALAKQEGLEGANAIIERALELYFTSIENEVWEKSLSSGWIKKLVLKGDSILYENIKCRKTLENYKPEDYTQNNLQSKGWNKL